MKLLLSQKNDNTIAELSIMYEKPKGWFARLIFFFVADWYCNWCLKNMLGDTKKLLTNNNNNNNSKITFMKLASSKFGLAVGIALSISFLLCNIILSIGGKDFSLDIANTIFHNVDFKPLMVESSFNFWKLICGMLILFLEGFFLGYVTGIIYNALNKKQATK